MKSTIKWDKPCYKCGSFFCDLSCKENRDYNKEERGYDVVIDALRKYRDTLWKMTEQNMNSEYIGMNIMDDIRLKQIEELDEAIRERKMRSQNEN